MRKKKIMIVDDDKMTQDMLVDFLGDKYDCIIKENGVEGLSYIEKNPGAVDLIITDLVMPVMDGYEMLECIQSRPINRIIPILVVTGVEELEDVKRTFDLGAKDIILKPLDCDILRLRVNNMLEMSEMRGVRNVMEDVMRIEIEEIVDSLGICTCPLCKRDLLSLTLNQVEPKYVNTDVGEVLTKVNSVSRDNRTKLLAIIVRCAETVKEKPRHI